MATLKYGWIRARYDLYVEDGPDLDDLPDLAHGVGKVTLRPHSTDPVRDSNDGRSRGVVNAPVRGAKLNNGVLRDRQGNEGVKVIREVDGTPVYWTATIEMKEEAGSPLFNITYQLVDWPEEDEDGLSTIFLHDLVAPFATRPPAFQDATIGAQAARDEAVKAAGRAETAAEGAAVVNDNLDAILAAPGHAQRAEDAANSFGLTATTATGAPGSNAAVTVSGDGPAYTLGFTVPRGAKGDKGDTGTTEWSGINGKPSTFPPATHTHADKADLVGGQVPTSQLPAVALSKPFPVADRAGMLGLTAEEGDVAVVATGADKGTYMLSSGPPTTFSSWVKLTTPDAPVQSVNGQTGTVNLNAANVGARPSSYVPAWSEVTSKPATFPPTIGTTAATAKAGSYVPAWSEVTGKPATFPAATHTHTAADTGAVARQGAAQGLWIGTTATLPATGTTGVLYVTY